MNREEIKNQIRDIIGLPLYDRNSRELTDINDHIESVLDEIIAVGDKQ